MGWYHIGSKALEYRPLTRACGGVCSKTFELELYVRRLGPQAQSLAGIVCPTITKDGREQSLGFTKLNPTTIRLSINNLEGKMRTHMTLDRTRSSGQPTTKPAPVSAVDGNSGKAWRIRDDAIVCSNVAGTGPSS